jgi:hypothetical protein
MKDIHYKKSWFFQIKNAIKKSTNFEHVKKKYDKKSTNYEHFKKIQLPLQVDTGKIDNSNCLYKNFR